MEHTREQQQTSRLRPAKRHSSATSSQFMYEMSHQQPASTTGPHLTSRKKRRGMIEKKRRDKINMSLGELRRLVPAAFEKEGSAKLEKAEILQMTVDYLRMLHECGLADSLTNSVKPSSIRSATPNAAPITSSTLAGAAAIHSSKSLAPPQTPSSRSSYSSSSSSSSASSTAVALHHSHSNHHHHHLHTSALHSAATAAASASRTSSSSGGGGGGGTPSKASKQEATATAAASMTAAAAAAAAHLHHQQHQFHQQQQQHIQTPTAGQDRWSAVAAHNQLHGFNYPHHSQPDLTQSPILDQFYQHHQNSHLHYHQNSHHQQYAYNHSC